METITGMFDYIDATNLDGDGEMVIGITPDDGTDPYRISVPLGLEDVVDTFILSDVSATVRREGSEYELVEITEL